MDFGRRARTWPRTTDKQPLRKFLVAAFHVAGAEDRAATAVVAGGEGLEVLAIKKVGLGREAAGHPLPGEVIARRITIDEVGEKPVGPGPPGDAADMHEPARQPHPFVVVQPAGLVEPVDEGVDAGHAGGGLEDIGRHMITDRGPRRRRRRLERFGDPVAQGRVNLPPVIPPAELRYELLSGGTGPRDRRVSDLGKGEDAVADPGREPGDGAVDMVSRPRVKGGVKGREPLEGRPAAAPPRQVHRCSHRSGQACRVGKSTRQLAREVRARQAQGNRAARAGFHHHRFARPARSVTPPPDGDASAALPFFDAAMCIENARRSWDAAG